MNDCEIYIRFILTGFIHVIYWYHLITKERQDETANIIKLYAINGNREPPDRDTGSQDQVFKGSNKATHNLQKHVKGRCGMKTTKTTLRGNYGQILIGNWSHFGISSMRVINGKSVYYNQDGLVIKTPSELLAFAKVRKLIVHLIKEKNDAYSWEKLDTSDFDRHGRGYSYSWDIYDYAMNTGVQYYAMQCRKWEKRTKNGYGSTKKSYYIIGKTKSGMYCEEVSGVMVHGCVKKGINVIDRHFEKAGVET